MKKNKRKIVSAVIVVISCIAMVLPMVLSFIH